MENEPLTDNLNNSVSNSVSNFVDDVFVTILTGSRPELLQKTLTNLPSFLFKEMYVLLNGNDKNSKFILQTYNIEYDFTPEIMHIGSAISFLADEALTSGKTYWLHIEDDWKFNESVDWLKRAKQMLNKSYQVRLRHQTEKVLNTHMITGQVIEWQDLPFGFLGKAHFTFNPFLMKTKDIPFVFPCKGERDAQKNALANSKLIVTQLKPGNFIHIGEENSLRLKTKCPV